MSVIRLMFEQYRLRIVLALVASAASGALSVAVIGFINERLLQSSLATGGMLARYAGLLLVLLVIGGASQLAMTTLGHRLVYGLRRTLVKRILDTGIERLEAVGGARLLASLSQDTIRITMAFGVLPQVAYGLVLTGCGFAYLAWLSPRLFAAIFAWFLVTLLVGTRLLGRTLFHMRRLRELDDRLVADYQTVIDGRKELTLNRARARHVYVAEFEADARAQRDHATWADAFNGLNDAWLNVMTLGAIGVSFFLAHHFGWASTSVAATYAMTILFLRAPTSNVAVAVPIVMGASVALRKINALDLAPYTPDFEPPPARIPPDWDAIHLESLTYRYPESFGDGGFPIGPVSLTLRRGEIVFVIGGNGSGKSTLARLLTGLYRPHGGCIRVDATTLGQGESADLHRLFAAVFSDFHLFRQPLGKSGEPASDEDVRHWLEVFEMATKGVVAEDGSLDTRLSQGQRKRLALVHALLEERPVLLLDEWAADQDPAFRRTFYTELLPQLRSAGKTVLAITHDDRYFHLADRILKLENGTLVDAME